MTWRVEYGPRIPKDLRRLDKAARTRVLDYVDDVLATGDPRARGKRLTGGLAGLWRYRVGDYRVIADIVDSRVVVYVIMIGHRADIYD